MEATQLTAILDRLNTTCCVVTTAFEGRQDGCFVSYVVSCSMEPARLLVMTSHENLTHELVEKSGVLAVHLVARGQEPWLNLFGHQTGHEVDKFTGLVWRRGVTGAPILDGAIAYLEGRVLQSMDCGDHTARLVEPVAAALRAPDAIPLTIFELFAKGLIAPTASLGNPWKMLNMGTRS